MLDLMFGIGPAHIRALCETDTGWGLLRCYTPAKVGDMTLDMIFLLLCDRKMLRSSKQQRVVSMSSEEAASIADPATGLVRGRTADGQLFAAAVGGDSLAGRLIAAEQQREQNHAERMKRRQERIQQRQERRKRERQERTNGH